MVSADLSDLVAQIYRADWRQLSLSASISQRLDPEVDWRLGERKATELGRVLGPLRGAVRIPRPDFPERGQVDTEHRLLIAPGGRYRVQTSYGTLVVSDGQQHWFVSDGVAHTEPIWLRRGPGREFCGLLTPQWLVACYELEVSGSVVAGGRPAIQVTGVPRTASTRRHGLYHLLDRVEVLVDAELGILLRSRQVFGGQARESAELHDLVINPPEADSAGLFEPPPGIRIADEADEGERFADCHPPAGAGWEVAGAAASAAATVLGFAIRHAPRRTPAWPSGDAEPDMPGDTALSPDDWHRGQPPDDRTVNLLHRTGRPAPSLTAEVHEWIDPRPLLQHSKVFRDKLPAPLQGIFGPDAVWDAVSARAAEKGPGYRVARLAVERPGQYRLDYSSGDWRKPYQAIASDGRHTTKLFRDRVASGPVKPLDPDLACMLDPAWLLSGWRLAVAGPVRAEGRDGIRIRGVATGAADDGADNLFTQADVIADAELGILLRMTTYVDGQPARRTELRDLRPLDSGTSFRIVPEPGMRSVTDSGGPLGDRNLPRPAEVAATAATLAAAGAVAATGWLDKHRTRRDRR